MSNDMSEIFKHNGYEFLIEKPSRKEYPYNLSYQGIKKDSSISYETAANLIISQIDFHEAQNKLYEQDKDYIKDLFFNATRGLRKSQCDNAIKTKIVNQNKISGTVISIKDNSLDDFKIYKTEYFNVKLLFKNGIYRCITDVEVTDRKNQVLGE